MTKLSVEIQESQEFIADLVIQSRDAAFKEDQTLKIVEDAQRKKMVAMRERDAAQRTLPQNNTTLNLINVELKGKEANIKILQNEVRKVRQQLDDLRNPNLTK